MGLDVLFTPRCLARGFTAEPLVSRSLSTENVLIGLLCVLLSQVGPPPPLRCTPQVLPGGGVGGVAGSPEGHRLYLQLLLLMTRDSCAGHLPFETEEGEASGAPEPTG